MVIAVGRNPALFIPEKEMIVSFVGRGFKKTLLSQIIEVDGMGPILKTVVSRSLQKLTELGLSFSISVNMEHDAEDWEWSYALVKINVDSENTDAFQNDVIKYAYEGINPSVGRAYYASFLTARNALSIYEKNPQVHRKVLLIEKSLDGTLNLFYCKLFNDIYGLETISLRYFNVFGPKQDPTSQYSAVIPKFIKLMLRGEKPVIFGDGLTSRDFSYIENESNDMRC